MEIFRSYNPFSDIASHTKRFFEYWLADEGFRKSLVIDPFGTANLYGLEINPMDVRLLWDVAYKLKVGLAPERPEENLELLMCEPEATHALAGYFDANNIVRRKMREDSVPLDPRFKAWRSRQIARCEIEFRPAYEFNTPHIVFACELSSGCSVGCWFCGVDAAKFKGNFPRTKQNMRLFLEVLGVIKHFAGESAARWGFLYWATDPFDNPDFEDFCLDFQGILGNFPVITTAQPMRDVSRTRRLLAMAKDHNASKVRFSILSNSLLRRVHEEFSAQELAITDLIPLNKKSSMLQKSAVGRAKIMLDKQAQEQNLMDNEKPDESISCVSGFLLNMVDKTIKLTSPCNSSEKWPLGYYVYEEMTFTDAPDLYTKIETMIVRHMPISVINSKPVRFIGNCEYQPLDDGFRISSKHGYKSFENNFLYRELGDLIRAGDKTPNQICSYFEQMYGIAKDTSDGWLEQLFANGILDEEPQGQSHS
ncbi:MAG: radical SAM family RiPP maturation amino acid epimerase [Sideroxydans sp.]|nr:radical SAM family RiPP maturation amino acid epimerase [Sideroxydans sp.]